MSSESPLAVTVRVTLRWRDIDVLGHVNQSVYHALLEEARAALLAPRDGGPRLSFVLARVELDHLREIRREDGEVDVIARVQRLGTKSITVAHEIRLLDGTVAASGATVLVAWDPRARTSRPLTDDDRARLSPA